MLGMFSLLLNKPLVSVIAVFCYKGWSCRSSARVLIALSAYQSGMKEAHVCMSAKLCTAAPHHIKVIIDIQCPSCQLFFSFFKESNEHHCSHCKSSHRFVVWQRKLSSFCGQVICCTYQAWLQTSFEIIFSPMTFRQVQHIAQALRVAWHSFNWFYLLIHLFILGWLTLALCEKNIQKVLHSFC